MYHEGIVEEQDVDRCRVRVRFADLEQTLSGWLRVLVKETADNKDFHIPDTGTLVACMLDARQEEGCVLGAVYSGLNKPIEPSADRRRVDFSDGAKVIYDRAEHKLTITVQLTGFEGAVEMSETLKVAGAAELSTSLKVAGGAAALSRDDKVQTALSDLKTAITGAATAPMDGGATLKAAIVAALSAWPPDTSCSKVTSD